MSPAMTRSRGFTMIELLVVVLVIGILAGIMVPVAMSVYNKGKITETQGFIKVLESAMEAYKADTNVYPEHYDSPSGPGQATFMFYLLETGRNSPYIDRAKLQTSSSAIPAPANIEVLDSWGQPLLYYRAPILGKGAGGAGSARFHTVQTTALLSAALGDFLGNDQSFNLWSPGSDGEDDSSDHPSQQAPYQGVAGGDPPDACDDDIINWK